MSPTPQPPRHNAQPVKPVRFVVMTWWRCGGGGGGVELTPELRAVDAVEPPSRQYAGVGILIDQRISPTHRTKALKRGGWSIGKIKGKRVYWRGDSKPPNIDRDLLDEVCSS